MILMITQHSKLYVIVIFLSSALVFSGLFFVLNEIAPLKSGNMSASVISSQNREIERKIIEIKDERGHRQIIQEMQNDTLPAVSINSEISAKSFILAEIPENSQTSPPQFNSSIFQVIYQKNAYQKLPIASLTKLMTALVSLENYKLDDIITISKKDLDTDGEAGKLRENERLIVLDLLKIMLVESSNDAAEALAAKMGRENFIGLMNNAAEKLGLENTHFVNPTGLDDQENYSTAYDLAKLVSFLISNAKFNLMWEISRIKTADVYSLDAAIHHSLKNSDDLLWKINPFDALKINTEPGQKVNNIFGGKTGFTDEAQGCMILISKMPDSYLITVILGSQDRFGDTEKLINSF